MILHLIMKQLQSRLIMQLRFNFLHATIERFLRICNGLPMNFAIYIWRWTWSQFEINQKLLDEVKWGQQWGLDIEYIKVLSVKAMKGHIWNWIWNFSRNNYRILILMLWVLIVLIKN